MFTNTNVLGCGNGLRAVFFRIVPNPGHRGEGESGKVGGSGRDLNSLILSGLKGGCKPQSIHSVNPSLRASLRANLRARFE